MGARFRAEYLILSIARTLSAREKITLDELSEIAETPSDFAESVLSSLGIESRELKREDLPVIIVRAWKAGFPLLDMALSAGWSTLEELVGVLLEEHGFTCRRNVRVKLAGRRYEIDLLALKGDILLCVDCKRWIKARVSELKRAAINQKDRCGAVARLIESGEVPCLGIAAEVKVFPVIVPLHSTAISSHEGVLVVGIYDLSAILRDISSVVLAEAGAQHFKARCVGYRKKQI
ncbi:MAG: restriction endonuclease [Thermofilum sp.]